MRGLQDRTAIVTGAASQLGIGFATATRLAEEGVKVVLTDINGAGVAERARELRDLGHKAVGVAHDGTDENSWEEVVRATKAEFGPPDIVVNNAGVAILSPVADMELRDWRRQLDVNGTLVFLGCRMAVREMRALGRGGAIVNVSSIAALVGAQGGGAYCASKAAVQMLTKVLALETAKEGIRVNSVHPGRVLTEMMHASLAGIDDPAAQLAALATDVPCGRLGLAAEVAAAIAFLASDDANYCTGSSLVVDGGFTAQ